MEIVPFVGIVEKRIQDGKKIGLCKVRSFYHHTADTTLLPTDLLPDAMPVEPFGTIWDMPKEGETVFGFFLDKEKQSMIIIGRMPNWMTREVTHPDGNGYKDARANTASFPRQMFKSYIYNQTDGVTVEELSKANKYPPYGDGGATTPFLSRGQNFPSQLDPATRKTYATGTKYKTAKGDQWNERPNEYAAVYPFNHTFQSESLHHMEFDDTPGAERVNLRHRMGTGFEFFKDGSKVERIVKDNYTVILGDDWMGVSGDCHIHVMGDATLRIDGDFTHRVKGDYMLQVDGDYKRLVKGDVVTNTQGSAKHSSGDDMIVFSDSTLYLKGSTLHENSSSTPEVDKIDSLKD